MQQALNASVRTLQLLQSNTLKAAAFVRLQGSFSHDRRLAGPSAMQDVGTAAASGILRCLPYELPNMSASITCCSGSEPAHGKGVRISINAERSESPPSKQIADMILRS